MYQYVSRCEVQANPSDSITESYKLINMILTSLENEGNFIGTNEFGLCEKFEELCKFQCVTVECVFSIVKSLLLHIHCEITVILKLDFS